MGIFKVTSDYLRFRELVEEVFGSVLCELRESSEVISLSRVRSEKEGSKELTLEDMDAWGRRAGYVRKENEDGSITYTNTESFREYKTGLSCGKCKKRFFEEDFIKKIGMCVKCVEKSKSRKEKKAKKPEGRDLLTGL